MYKKKDILILAALRNDARISLTDISKKTEIPISTIYERVQLFQQKLIRGYTALVDFSLFGFMARATIAIKANHSKKEMLQEYLFVHQNVNSLYRINNGYDYMIECIFKNVKELEEFLDVLDYRFKVKTRDVFYLIDDIKRESFLSNQHFIEDRKSTRLNSSHSSISYP